MNILEHTVGARLRRVIDGDSLEVICLPLPGMAVIQKVRLLNIDCPELNTEDGQRAKLFVAGWMTARKGIILLESNKRDSFGRLLARVRNHRDGGDRADLGNALMVAGLAKSFDRRRKKNRSFSEAMNA